MSKRQEKPQVDEKRFLALIRTLFGTGNSPAEGVVLEGRRFVHLERLADGLVCKKCYAILSLLDATGEEKDGLASIFDVKCRNCQAVSKAYCDINQDYSIELDVRRNLLKEPHFGKRTGINGRRILDMELFANELLCKKCNNSILSLLDVVKEDIYGFASIFHIACRVCKEVSNVYTDKQHTVGDGEEKHFNLNTSTVGCKYVEKLSKKYG